MYTMYYLCENLSSMGDLLNYVLLENVMIVIQIKHKTIESTSSLCPNHLTMHELYFESLIDIVKPFFRKVYAAE